MRRARFARLLMLPLAAAVTPPALAQTTSAAAQGCAQADLAAVVDDMGAQLRAASMEAYPRLQARMRQLAAAKGWPELEAEAKAQELLDDAQSRTLDEKAAQLLIELDRKGPSETPSPTCGQVAELKSIASQLLQVTRAKSVHSLARLDAELGVKAATKAPDKILEKPPERPLEAKPAEAPGKPARPVMQPNPAVATAAPPPRPQQPLPWETQTVRPPDPSAPTGPPQPWSPPAASADLQFTEEDIRAAGRGIFGTISAELASVIEHAFKSYGRPTGYILGTEGGAALLAGLRYGEGTLVTKRDGERRIYWQGPSVGYDFGIAGSRTLVLVYNLQDPEAMLARFGGVDGSAYLVGGVGLTLLKKGPIILAPIRTGLGLRVGANVGYLKFTSQPSFNPF
jgi:hypothetical protein